MTPVFLYVCKYYCIRVKNITIHILPNTTRKLDISFFLSIQWLSYSPSVLDTYTPLIPHFYIAKLGYGGVYLFFLFLLQNKDCGYSLEPPWRGTQDLCFEQKSEKYLKTSNENFQFLTDEKSLYIVWPSFCNVTEKVNNWNHNQRLQCQQENVLTLISCS